MNREDPVEQGNTSQVHVKPAIMTTGATSEEEEVAKEMMRARYFMEESFWEPIVQSKIQIMRLEKAIEKERKVLRSNLNKINDFLCYVIREEE